MKMNYKLFEGDCLDILPTIADGSIDAVIADPPYGTTACKWDSVIPLGPMWEQLKRVIKPRGAIVLFAAQPFTSALVMSNAGWFRYSWVWRKNKGTGHLNAPKMPLRAHEDIVVFGDSSVSYAPQMRPGDPYQRLNCSRAALNKGTFGKTNESHSTVNMDGARYPLSVIDFSVVERTDHPTQKPVDLMRYLIRTYTNAGETVLDFCYGSGTTGVAALQEGRNFVGMEKDAGYYALGVTRIEQVQPALVEVMA
jgi:site-specific DNA-methyltransferase (adenine-specific)